MKGSKTKVDLDLLEIYTQVSQHDIGQVKNPLDFGRKWQQKKAAIRDFI